jgi:hypothetical protein
MSCIEIRAALAAVAHVALLLCIQPANAESPATTGAAPSSIGIGPFRLGMSLDEIRAAAPQVEWRNVMVSRYTGRVFSMRSDDKVPIAGVEFEVEALAHYYQHQLRLDGARRVEDAAACERAGLELLTAIESQAGPFTSYPPVTTPSSGGGLYWQTQRSANGSITVMPSAAPGTAGRTDGETMTFGSGSTVLVEAFDDKYRPRPRVKMLSGPPAVLRMRAHNRDNWREVEAEINYGDNGDLNCAVRVDLATWKQPPLPQTFDTSQAKVLREATIAERHYVHTPVAGRPGPAIDVELACEIDRRTGWPMSCGVVRPDDLSLEQEDVAISLAHLMTFDVSGVDRDDPQQMRGTVRVKVDPAARKPIDILTAPRTPVDDVIFTMQPDPEAVRIVPPVLGDDEGAGAEVKLVCRIESDGSLLCADPDASTDPQRKAAIAVATRVSALEYRAAPNLRDGEPSAGRVFELTPGLRITLP